MHLYYSSRGAYLKTKKMNIIFIKNHEVGIQEGHIINNAQPLFAQRMIDAGYAKEYTPVEVTKELKEAKKFKTK